MVNATRFVVHEFEPDENTLQRKCRRCEEIQQGYVLNPPMESVKKPDYPVAKLYD